MDMTTTQHKSLERLDAIHEVCEEHDLDDYAFTAWCDNFHITSNYEDEVQDFANAYMGYYDEFVRFAEQVFDDCMSVPEHLAYYIDYDKYARDLQHDYWTHEDGHGVYVFRNL